MLRWAEFKVTWYFAILGSQKELFTYLELYIYEIISINNESPQDRTPALIIRSSLWKEASRTGILAGHRADEPDS